MSTLYIIRGIPGSGKSTIAKAMLASGMVHGVFEADFWMKDAEDNYKFDPTMLGYAHAKCLSETKYYLGLGWDVAVSNTFTTEKEMKPYLDLAKEQGYIVHVMIVENRHGGFNQHNVPDETLNRMRDRMRQHIKL